MVDIEVEKEFYGGWMYTVSFSLEEIVKLLRGETVKAVVPTSDYDDEIRVCYKLKKGD